jgi:hypothetical protein
MEPIDVFRTYLALKNHFSTKKYDYIKYNGKVKVYEQSFLKRKDRMWFEKLSRQKNKQEIIQFFVGNFVMSNDPQSLWIGDIIKNGQTTYLKWRKKIQSLKYVFKQDVNYLLDNYSLDELFNCDSGSHPIIIKEYLKENITIETLVILNKIYSFAEKLNKKLFDPIWETVYLLIIKYDVFLVLNLDKYKSIIDSRA